MGTLEIRPAEGGADASAFAEEMAAAVSKHADTQIARDGNVYSLHRL